MDALSALIARDLGALYARVGRKVHDVVDPLTDAQLWQRPYPYGNSIGHLLLHLTGNIQYYIGAQIAGTGYVRDRPREFNDPGRRPKADVLQAFDEALALVDATLKAQRSGDWTAAYSAAGADDVHDRFMAFARSASHGDHHLAQMIYLRKQLELGSGTAR